MEQKLPLLCSESYPQQHHPLYLTLIENGPTQKTYVAFVSCINLHVFLKRQKPTVILYYLGRKLAKTVDKPKKNVNKVKSDILDNTNIYFADILVT